MALLVGELYALLFLEKKAFMRGLKEAEAAAQATGTSIGSSFMAIGKIAALGLAAAVVGLAAFGGASLNAAMEFQKGMARVQTLIGKGSAADARIAELGESVKEMSKVTGKSLKDLTDGLYDVIGTFTDTADSAKWLELAAKAGAAGMSTTKDAILLLSAVTKSYGDTSIVAAQKAADLIFQTANLGVTTFPQMAASMGKVLPISAALKVSQEELFGAMATLTGVTGDTAEVTTQLRSIMSAFLKPNTLMNKAIAETGFVSGTAMVQQLGLSGAMKLIGGTSVVAEKGIAKVFGRVEALTAVLALNGAQADAWVWKTQAMRDSAGLTARAFEIQQATASAMVDRIGAALGVLAVNMGNKLMPAWTSFLKWVEKHMPEIESLILGMTDAIMSAFSIIGGVVGWFVDKMATAWKILGDFGMQGPLIGGVLAVIAAGFVALGVAAAGAAISVLAATWPILAVIVLIALAIKGLQLVFEALGISVEDVFKNIGNFAKDFAQDLIDIIAPVIDVIAMIPGPFQEGANAVKATLASMKKDVENWGKETGMSGFGAGQNIGKQIDDGLAGTVDKYDMTGQGAGKALLGGIAKGVDGGMALSQAQLEDLGISMDDALAAGINVGEDTVQTAVVALVDQFGYSLKGVKQAAAESGSAAMYEMAKAIQDHRTEPISAFNTLKDMMKNSLTPLAEAGKLGGQLLSKTLAKALKDNRPDVVAQANAVVVETADHLGELAAAGGKSGKAAMHKLNQGIRSKIPEVRAASKHAKNVAVAQMNAAKKEFADAGARAAAAFAAKIRALNFEEFHIRLDIQAELNPNRHYSGYASGAWKIRKNEMAFLHQGEMVVPAAAAQRLREASTSPSYSGMPGMMPQQAPSIGTLIGSLTINAGSDVSKPAAQRFGQHVLDAVASGLREQTARGVS